MGDTFNETWICYTRIPGVSGTTGEELKMFDDIERYAKMRIEAELGVKGVDFNIARIEVPNLME